MPEQTLIMLRGSAGTGKTALWHAMQRGQSHLLEIPALREAMAAGWSWLSLEDVQQIVEMGEVRAALDKAFGDNRFLVADACSNEPLLIGAVDSGRCDSVRVWVFAAWWLVEARRKTRSDYKPEAPLYDHDLSEYIIESRLPFPHTQDIFVNSSDYPAREATYDEVVALVNPQEQGSLPQLPPPAECYQHCVRVQGDWLGSVDLGRRAFEQERLDRVLPAEMAGATVLDVGAAEGGSSFEAINRGAAYVTACEADAGRCQFMRAIRDARRLPMSVWEGNAVGPSLPRRYEHEHEALYDYGLLLNILHHTEDPVPLLWETLECCRRVIIETPFATGTEPVRLGTGPYPNALCLPPAWVETVAQSAGFVLDDMRVSNMAPGSRLIYELRRE